MSAYVFEADGKEFVSGLFWQPTSATNKSDQSKEIKQLAKELKFNLHVVRTGSTATVGFCNSEESIKVGSLSAAAVVSKSLEVQFETRDFLFVSRLPDNSGWLYVAQKDGVLLPDGDQVFKSDDEARAKVLEDRQLGNWERIFVPEIWGLQGSKELSFSDLLPRKGNGKLKVHKWWRVMPVEAHKALSIHTKKLIALGALVAISFYGYSQFKQYKMQKAIEEAQRMAQMQQNEQGVLVPVHPWKSLPLPADLLTECLAAMATINLYPGNWDISAINCTSSTLTVTWKPRPYGWIQHLQSVVPGVVIALDGSVASKTVPLNQLPTGLDEAVMPQNLRLIDMHSAAQRYGVKFTATPPPPAPPSLPGQEAKVAAKDWQEIGWSADNVAMPSIVLTALQGNGFRMNSMSGHITNGQIIWKMEGTQYVQP